MTSREYKDKDYESLVEWYKGWNLPVTPKSYIPVTSLVVEKELKLVCVGFLYQLGNTPMFWIEGIISNPTIEKNIRKEALDLLISDLVKLAKKSGCEMLLSSSPREGLISLFKHNEFKEAPELYSHLARYV